MASDAEVEAPDVELGQIKSGTQRDLLERDQKYLVVLTRPLDPGTAYEPGGEATELHAGQTHTIVYTTLSCVLGERFEIGSIVGVWTGQASKRDSIIEIFIQDSSAGFPATPTVRFQFPERRVDYTLTFVLSASAVSYVNRTDVRQIKIKVNAFRTDAFRLSTDHIIFFVGAQGAPQPTPPQDFLPALEPEVVAGALVTGGLAQLTAVDQQYFAMQAPVVLRAIADAEVDERFRNRNFGDSINPEVASDQNRDKRLFVRFDLSSIPPGSTIQSAVLQLFTIKGPGAARTYEAHRVLANWSESTVDWSNQPSVAASPSSSVPAVPVEKRFSRWDVTTDTQAIVSGQASNFGWRIRDSVEDSPTRQVSQYRSREASQVEKRPALLVSFIPPPGPVPLLPHSVIFEVETGTISVPGAIDQVKVQWRGHTDAADVVLSFFVWEGAIVQTLPDFPTTPAATFTAPLQDETLTFFLRPQAITWVNTDRKVLLRVQASRENRFILRTDYLAFVVFDP